MQGLVDEGVSVSVGAMAANGNTVMHIAEYGASKAADRSGSARLAEKLLNQSLIFHAVPALRIAYVSEADDLLVLRGLC